MSAPKAVWSPRKNNTPSALEEVESPPTLLPWRLIFWGVVLPLAVAFGVSTVGGSSEEPAAKAPPRPVKAAGHLEGNGPEELFSNTGDFFFDLCEAFEKGGDSELVRLETQWEHNLFDRMRKARHSKGRLTGLTFSLIERRADGVEIYHVEDHTGPLGLIVLKWIETRWNVLGVLPPTKGAGSHSPRDKASRDEAISALNALIESRDPGVRKRAADAIKAIEPQKPRPPAGGVGGASGKQ